MHCESTEKAEPSSRRLNENWLIDWWWYSRRIGGDNWYFLRFDFLLVSEGWVSVVVQEERTRSVRSEAG